MNDTKAFSLRLYSLLDNVGYNQDIVNYRRSYCSESDDHFNLTHEIYTRFTAGSKGEGFSRYCESDTDFLCIDKYTVCAISSIETQPGTVENVGVFEMVSDQCEAGHYKLKLVKQGPYPHMESAVKSLVRTNHAATDTYISSEIYTKSLVQFLTKNSEGGVYRKENSGPAVSWTLRGLKNDLQTDHVFGFRCISQENILSEWIARPRKYTWPSRELIQEVMKQEAQMVPVGSRLSECRDLEWRICFIPGEMKLTHSLNEAQYKIYILLKLLNKSVLKPICSEMSSYIMKNIVYWLVEEHPTERFTADNLFENLMMALTKLHQAIKDNYLPYYVLPGRNLLCGRISGEHVEPLDRIIETLRKEGPRLIFRCKKIKDAWAMSAAELEIQGGKLDQIEKGVLELQSFKRTFKFQPNSNWKERDRQLYETNEYMEIVVKVRDLAWPTWRDHFTTKEDMQKKMTVLLNQILI